MYKQLFSIKVVPPRATKRTASRTATSARKKGFAWDWDRLKNKQTEQNLSLYS